MKMQLSFILSVVIVCVCNVEATYPSVMPTSVSGGSAGDLLSCLNGVSVATTCTDDATAGGMKTFTTADGAQTITARGFNLPEGDKATAVGTSSDMWCKVYNGGETCETGLGMLTDGQGNHEIDLTHFVQLDFSAVTVTQDSIQLTIASVQAGEAFQVYNSAAEGVLGTLAYDSASSPVDTCVRTISIPYSSKYYSVIATSHNVLIGSVTIGCQSSSIAPSATPTVTAGDGNVPSATTYSVSYAPSAAPTVTAGDGNVPSSTTYSASYAPSAAPTVTAGDGNVPSATTYSASYAPSAAPTVTAGDGNVPSATTYSASYAPSAAPTVTAGDGNVPSVTTYSASYAPTVTAGDGNVTPSTAPAGLECQPELVHKLYDLCVAQFSQFGGTVGDASAGQRQLCPGGGPEVWCNGCQYCPDGSMCKNCVRSLAATTPVTTFVAAVRQPEPKVAKKVAAHSHFARN